MEKENSQIDIDELMEMIEDVPENEDIIQHIPNDEEEKEDYRAEREEAPTKVESSDAKIAYEAINNNRKLQQENERLKAEKAEAERLALQGVLRNYETQIDLASHDIERLNSDLIRARDEGDTATSVAIESKIRDNYERIRDYKSKVNEYQSYASRRQEEPKAETAPGNQMAFEWMKENESWLTDDRYRDKRQYADQLFKEMSENGMNINNLNFWTKFERKLTEFDAKKNEKQQHRMPKNMVTYNPNGSNSNNTKKSNYKDNPEFLQKVAYLAKNVIRNDKILEDKQLLNSTLRHYHKVWKAGNFKHLPINIQ